jgi:uncharacterized protein
MSVSGGNAGQRRQAGKGVAMTERCRAVLALAALCSFLVLAVAPASLAQSVEPQPRSNDRPSIDTLRERANAGTVGIISGGINGTYVRVAAELAAVLDDGDALRVLPIIGAGHFIKRVEP